MAAGSWATEVMAGNARLADCCWTTCVAPLAERLTEVVLGRAAATLGVVDGAVADGVVACSICAAATCGTALGVAVRVGRVARGWADVWGVSTARRIVLRATAVESVVADVEACWATSTRRGLDVVAARCGVGTLGVAWLGVDTAATASVCGRAVVVGGLSGEGLRTGAVRAASAGCGAVWVVRCWAAAMVAVEGAVGVGVGWAV